MRATSQNAALRNTIAAKDCHRAGKNSRSSPLKSLCAIKLPNGLAFVDSHAAATAASAHDAQAHAHLTGDFGAVVGE